LKRSNRLSENPEEYENENDRKCKIGLAINARKGDGIEYLIRIIRKDILYVHKKLASRNTK
jgi:hypothetical protein